jgi:signal transduction histidine kinase/DNA-binding NarL/FixJ family response regulator/putative methionine-R-sulfoxide reductase with GAF domain
MEGAGEVDKATAAPQDALGAVAAREADMARRNRELAALVDATRAIASSLDLEEILQAIVREAASIAGVPAVRLFLVDEDSHVLRWRVGIGLPPEAERDLAIPFGESFSGQVVATGKPLAVPDTRGDPRLHYPQHAGQYGLLSYLGLPVKVGDRVIGVLVFNTDAPRVYGEDEIAFLSAFADQAAIAIQNARLYEAARRELAEHTQAEEALARRTQQLEAIRVVSEEITRELDLDRMLDLIIRRAVELVSADSGVVRLWDEAERVLIPRHRAGVSPHKSFYLRLGEGIAGVVAERRQAMIVNDFRTSPYVPAYILEQTTHQATLGQPLLYYDRLVGTINVDRESAERPFTEADRDLLGLFATQAAIAIENARLYAEVKRPNEELQALFTVTNTVTRSLDIASITQAALLTTIEVLHVDAGRLYIFDEKGHVLRLTAHHGLPPEVLRDFECYAPGQGIIGRIFQEGQPIFFADITADPKHAAMARSRLGVQLGFRSAAGLPILVRGKPVGVIYVFGRAVREFSPEDLALLSAIGGQVGIAVENARLYREIQQHAATLEARVKERTAELEEALRVKVEFLGKMSHELRTPLNFVLGFSDLLQQGMGGPLTPKQTTYLDRIQTGGKRLLSLVNDVLDIAQVDAGKSRLHLEPVILGPLIQEVLGLVQVQATQKSLKVMTALDPWLPLVVADRFKLAQILHNLVGNAVKFTPDGGSITIRTYQEAEGRKQKAESRRQKAESRRQKAEGSGQTSGELPPLPTAECPLPTAECRVPPGWPSVVIEVEDTGIGIQPENLDSIFEAFYQVDGSQTRAHAGAGLGLALVRKLVELHGGRVWAESAGPGQGARFVVRLPRLEVPKAKRVLLVEDDALVRIPMAAALESAGFTVLQAATGADALAAMGEGAPDLLILDILLPDLDGREILRRVREAEDVRTLPVLVVTGLESVNAEQALALGADEFLTKPVSPRVLVDTVVRLLAHFAVGSTVVGQRAEGAEEERDKGAGGQRQLRIAECGLRNGEKPIAECGMNEV